MRRTPLIPLAAAALSLVATAFAPAANAADPDTVADGLVSPLSLGVAADGTVFVSQNFASLLTEAAPGADAEPIFADEGQREIGGVSVSGDTVTFTATSMGGPAIAKVYTYAPDGEGWAQTEIADTWAAEKAMNPDGKTRYGIQGLSKSCKRSIPKNMRQGVVAYKGIKESHPYATTTVGGTTYVADAAANAIWAVQGESITPLATLPPVKVKVTKKLRKQMHLPRCTQGKTFKGEPVPTDVEVDPLGQLHVTTLGGGLGEMLPVGAVYAIDPATGRVTKDAGGLMSPVGLAISPTGTAYISLLFPGLVMQQPLGGAPSVFAEVPFAGDVEVNGTDVYVTQTDLANDGTQPPAGKVLKFSTAG
ncbi:MAG TPA: ScyD/ScyE family protein [Nocardioides sp.]|nr:ScyD/ScyE family protein [Nocardioides sp.]